VFDDLRQHGTPFVAVACGPHSMTPLVNIDEAYGTQISLDYLHMLGHKRVAFIGNTEHAGTRERLAAFQKYAAENGFYWTDDYLQPSRYARGAAVAATRTLLSLPTPPTAIFCTADLLGLGAITGALEMGWRVPEAVSVISFDDIEEAADSFPALTTVRQPVGDMANRAIQLLLTLIEEPTGDALDSRILVEPRLMIRRSCAPAFDR
jgi:LacI family repressor for deo operon, udp, cdd, tsx, nupC, and nupG